MEKLPFLLNKISGVNMPVRPPELSIDKLKDFLGWSFEHELLRI
jgi:hypothetical protein